MNENGSRGVRKGREGRRVGRGMEVIKMASM